MNSTAITRIAAMANALRPDWPHSSLVTMLTKNLAERAYRDVAVAMAWIATDPDTTTPARVLENGPWWQAVADPSQRGATPDNAAGHRCPSCPAWVVRGEEHVCGQILDPDQTHAAAAAARAAIHQTEESQ